MRRLLAMTALMLLLDLGASPAGAAATGGTDRRVTTSATGTAEGAPDTATIALAVTTGGATAQEALAANATRTQRVIAGARFVGVARRDIRTSNVSLFPTFDEDGHISGFAVSSRLAVTSHDVANAGKVIDAAVQLAGEDVRVENVSLSIEDTGALVRRARVEAVRTAREQADQLARAAGAKLGRVRQIVETENPPGGLAFASAGALKAADATVPIEPGRQELEIRVKVVYSLR